MQGSVYSCIHDAICVLSCVGTMEPNSTLYWNGQSYPVNAHRNFGNRKNTWLLTFSNGHQVVVSRTDVSANVSLETQGFTYPVTEPVAHGRQQQQLAPMEDASLIQRQQPQGQGGNEYPQRQQPVVQRQQPPSHADRLNQIITTTNGKCQADQARGVAPIELPYDQDFARLLNPKRKIYNFPVEGGTIEIPIFTIPAGRHLFRGANVPCDNFDPAYNFDWATWWFWRQSDAREFGYAPGTQRDQQGNIKKMGGCIGEYKLTHEMRLLDFWDYRVLLLLEYIIENRLFGVTEEEINAYKLYSGRGVRKGRRTDSDGRPEYEILHFAESAGLLDQDMRNDEWYHKPRSEIPNGMQFQDNRCIPWGPEVGDTDHSSTRKMDQVFARFLSRVFENQIDGIAVPFQVPGTMHGFVHSEIFLLPGFGKILGAGKLRAIVPHQQGGRKKTRKQKQKKSKKTKSKTLRK